eukprot:TRINITY_DN95_c0_g1_i2.p1 TRINITY_DN95_c0_g1~~TRINITY_DN95_c0_g1_i2.p1  ORF type:complete len:271 (-),score=59.53 TRINITY_DN95_c0_g1_i2:48-860(-)
MPKKPQKKVGKSKQIAPLPQAAKTGKIEKKKRRKPNPLFVARPKNYGIGNDIQPRRDLSRFVRWPLYVQRQRKKRILLQRLIVPGPINQFRHPLDKNHAAQLFALLHAHRPENKKEKKERLTKLATLTEPQSKDEPKPNTVKYGLKHITALVEQKKAELVVIAHDVDPIELVVWLPTLCRKKGVPYVIVKSKSRLGQVVHKKTAAVLAFVNIRPQDKATFANLVQVARDQFLDKYPDSIKKTGGNFLGRTVLQQRAKVERIKKKGETISK